MVKTDSFTNVNSTELLEIFAKQVSLPLSLIPALEPIVEFRTTESGSVLISPGEIDSHIYFIIDGFGVVYGITENEEKRYLFLKRHSRVLCSLETLAHGHPARYWYELQKGGLVAIIDDNELMSLAATNADIGKWYAAFMKDALARFEEKIESFIMADAKDRLIRLYEETPEIFTEAMNKQVASFIGITPVHLSRLLSSKQNKKSNSRK